MNRILQSPKLVIFITIMIDMLGYHSRAAKLFERVWCNKYGSRRHLQPLLVFSPTNKKLSVITPTVAYDAAAIQDKAVILYLEYVCLSIVKLD